MSFVVSDCLCLPSSALCVAVVSSSLKRERESLNAERSNRESKFERAGEREPKKERDRSGQKRTHKGMAHMKKGSRHRCLGERKQPGRDGASNEIKGKGKNRKRMKGYETVGSGGSQRQRVVETQELQRWKVNTSTHKDA